MRLIGHIRQLQIQQDALKKGEGTERYYDLDALAVVPAVILTPEGVVGLVDNKEIHDVHHSRHHHSRHRQSSAISFNFTKHYEQMHRRFGPELSLGCGGENILIELIEDVNVALLFEDPEVTLVIETMDSRRGSFTGIKVAKPCVPFSKYVLNVDAGAPADMVKETLQFLDGGMRGYYCAWEGAPLEVSAGDKVLVST